MSAVKWVDLPPVWLLGFVAATWWIAETDPFLLGFGGMWAQLVGGLLVGGGLVLMGLAVIEMRKSRTTVVPHRDADHLVTSGIFKRTRNPIYLGDALVLAGLILRFDAPLALPLLPVFVWLIERRFILPEEDRLRRKFRMDFARYERDVRRWI
ncbi:MAG: isoprenylcysteine carboxylmethyltransferase family protein [Rubellimicrobium sp.]|nr:isoprenylcysteine carboxylmethyltransferase family protein [Rubellimicrobium sp.]